MQKLKKWLRARDRAREEDKPIICGGPGCGELATLLLAFVGNHPSCMWQCDRCLKENMQQLKRMQLDASGLVLMPIGADADKFVAELKKLVKNAE